MAGIRSPSCGQQENYSGSSSNSKDNYMHFPASVNCCPVNWWSALLAWPCCPMAVAIVEAEACVWILRLVHALNSLP